VFPARVNVPARRPLWVDPVHHQAVRRSGTLGLGPADPHAPGAHRQGHQGGLEVVQWGDRGHSGGPGVDADHATADAGTQPGRHLDLVAHHPHRPLSDGELPAEAGLIGQEAVRHDRQADPGHPPTRGLYAQQLPAAVVQRPQRAPLGGKHRRAAREPDPGGHCQRAGPS
jgi:hypothetical protein